VKSLSFILIFFCFLGCEEKTATTTQTKARKINSETGSKGFALGTYKLSASENAHRNEIAPKPKRLETCIKKALLTSPLFSAEGGSLVNLRLTYDVLQEASTTSIVLLAEMEGGQLEPFSTGLKSDLDAQNSEEKGKQACANIASKLTNNLSVSVASEKELIAIISDQKSDSKVRKRAIQKIREKDVKSAAPALSLLLKSEDVKIAVAAAATLAKFGYVEARPAMLALGEKLSREKNTSFIPMLYILADAGGPEISEYLSTVASSHAVPKVREIAKKALKNASRKK